MFDGITPLLITFNEAPNIARTLDKLGWARRIVVVDSGSSDGTLEILARYPQVALFNRVFDNFADQCNFGLAQVQTEWVLSLDADYELSQELVDELRALKPHEHTTGYRARFIYRIYGRPLRGTLYPPRVVLYRAGCAQYKNEGHGHRVSIDGGIDTLNAPIYHDDRKPLARWLLSQQRYAWREAEHLLKSDRATYRALRDVLSRNVQSVWRRALDMAKGRPVIAGDTVEEFWALKHLDFEIGRGDVVGIIGSLVQARRPPEDTFLRDRTAVLLKSISGGSAGSGQVPVTRIHYLQGQWWDG